MVGVCQRNRAVKASAHRLSSRGDIGGFWAAIYQWSHRHRNARALRIIYGSMAGRRRSVQRLATAFADELENSATSRSRKPAADRSHSEQRTERGAVEHRGRSSVENGPERCGRYERDEVTLMTSTCDLWEPRTQAVATRPWSGSMRHAGALFFYSRLPEQHARLKPIASPSVRAELAAAVVGCHS